MKRELDTRTFIERYLVDEIKQMQAANVRLHLFIGMLQGIETAGALMDDKPFKAKGQGKKRFALALKKLFPESYLQLNHQKNLYGILRSHTAHCILPANGVQLTAEGDYHLRLENEILTISIEVLFKDYLAAIRALLLQLQSGKLPDKKIYFQSIESL